MLPKLACIPPFKTVSSKHIISQLSYCNTIIFPSKNIIDSVMVICPHEQQKTINEYFKHKSKFIIKNYFGGFSACGKTRDFITDYILDCAMQPIEITSASYMFCRYTEFEIYPMEYMINY